jgi:hypothetical protein
MIIKIIFDNKLYAWIAIIVVIIPTFFWLQSDLGCIKLKELKILSLLGISSSILVAILPYVSEIILGGIIYFRNSKRQKEAFTEIKRAEDFCNTSNEL